MRTTNEKYVPSAIGNNIMKILLIIISTVFISGVRSFSTTKIPQRQIIRPATLSPTALNVWWFGGTENSEINHEGDSCELVAVRIERTSSNSRKIAGSITVPTPLEDVWAILTDYNRLAAHVPNLVESRIVSQQSSGEQGDGSFRCKLFQKGAQKIVGFEFGASVTMQMIEKIINASSSSSSTSFVPQQRKIGFTCVDSFFFKEFDGEWEAKEQLNNDGQIETVLNYVVDVRPNGPVPVAALEWRIREDVPTNLRAVKKAAMEFGLEGVLAHREGSSSPRQRRLSSRNAAAPSQTSVVVGANSAPTTTENGVRKPQAETTDAIRRATVRRPAVVSNLMRSRNGTKGRVLASQQSKNEKPSQQRNGNSAKPRQHNEKKTPLPFKVMWEADETMAAYLRE